MNGFHLPTRISFGGEFPPWRSSLSAPFLVVRSASCSPEFLNDEFLEKMSVNGKQPAVLIKEPGEPSSAAVNELAASVGETPGAVVAIGGGSVLDTAKGIALLIKSGGKLEDYEFGERPISGALPLHALPTTCGSGSEVTPFAVFTNSSSRRKFTLGHDCLRPQSAYLAPRLVTNLSPRALLSSALDALIHNLEAACNTSSSLLIRPLAVEGMGLIFRHLDAFLANPADEVAAEPILQSSLYGGMCIANSRTGLVHTLSVACSEYTDVPHGLLNAWLLPFVLRHQAPFFMGRLGDIISAATNNNFRNDGDAIRFLTDWVTARLERLALPRPVLLNPDRHHMVDRILQDKGLPLVAPGGVRRAELERLLEEVVP